MPLPELAGWGDRRGFASSLQPFQSAHVICGRGELVTSTVLCTIESEPSHAVVPAAEEQSLEERSSLFECLGIKTSWLHCSGKIAMGILLVVLNFSTLYLLLLFLCFFRLTLLDLPYTSPKHLKSGSSSVICLQNRDDLAHHLIKPLSPIKL